MFHTPGLLHKVWECLSLSLLITCISLPGIIWVECRHVEIECFDYDCVVFRTIEAGHVAVGWSWHDGSSKFLAVLYGIARVSCIYTPSVACTVSRATDTKKHSNSYKDI